MTGPRPAATVVVLRDGAAGPEVLMVRRTRGASFMADAYVFPGGRVDDADGADALRFQRAASRELREEAGLDVPPEALVPFAHWITPSAEPKRFDARFFVAALPPGQEARADENETHDALWATPAEVLERHGRGELKLPPPTICNLEDLQPHRTVEDALAWARARVFAAILPKLVALPCRDSGGRAAGSGPDGNSIAIVLPWDSEYASLPGEGQPIDPAHPCVSRLRSRFVLAEGRWWNRTV